MRRKQIIGIRWDDFSFEKGAIFLRAENSKTKREWCIPLGTMAEDFKTLRPLSKKVVSKDYFKKGQVFDISSVHKLRHSFGTEATKSGDLVSVQKIMGHSDIRATSSYTHPDLNRMQKIMDESTNTG